MCTVSWNWELDRENNDSLLRIYFNRDERRIRDIAHPPELIETDATSILCPIDPQSNGTWIASNSSGVTVALLNNYSVPIDPKKSYQSRGQLVSEVSQGSNMDQAMSNIYACVSQHHYPAFSLLIWDYHSQRTQLFTWNEEVLDFQQPVEPFLTSSSWNTSKVQAFRRQLYLDQVVNGTTCAPDFHASSTPETEKESVFMSRELTQTVSRTFITVDQSHVSMEYYDRATDLTSSHTLQHLSI